MSNVRRWAVIAVLGLIASIAPVATSPASAQPVVTIMQIQGAGTLSPFEG